MKHLILILIDCVPPEDFGDIETNGMGHKITTTVSPVTGAKTQAVFIPKLKKGYWNGAVENLQSISENSIVDDDVDALRANQLQLILTELGSNPYDV